MSELVPEDYLTALKDGNSTDDVDLSEEARQRAVELFLQASSSGNFDAIPKLYGPESSHLLRNDETLALHDFYKTQHGLSNAEW